jgi:integrase
MQIETEYKLCRVANSNGDLKKPWYVEYYIFSETQNKLIRKRHVLAQKTAKERYAHAKLFSDHVNKMLLDGHTIQKIPKQKNTDLSPESTIIEAITNFIAYKEKTTKLRTFQSYTSDIRNFTAYLEENNLIEITVAKFTETIATKYIDDLSIKGFSNRRRNNLKATISGIFNFLIKRKIIDTNPFEGIERLNCVTKKHAAYQKNLVNDIKKYCLENNDEQLWLFISFIYYAAIRPGEELRRLLISDIKEKTIFIDGKIAKNNRSQHIMIPEPLQKIINQQNLRSYPPNYYVFSYNGPGTVLVGKHYFYDKHVEVLKKLNLQGQNYDLYSWKHTGVIALFQATQNIELIRQHCRHSDLATTQKYLRDLGLFIDYEQINRFPEI